MPDDADAATAGEFLDEEEEEAVTQASSVFGTIEVLVIETAAKVLLLLLQGCLYDFLSDEDDGKGEEDAERLQGEEAGLAVSGSTRQAVGESRSILCLARRWLRM